MARNDGRVNSHIQEKKPAGVAAAAPALAAEEQQAIREGQQPGWRWAAALWAIVFLFLTLLMVFDLVAGFVHG